MQCPFPSPKVLKLLRTCCIVLSALFLSPEPRAEETDDGEITVKEVQEGNPYPGQFSKVTHNTSSSGGVLCVCVRFLLHLVFIKQIINPFQTSTVESEDAHFGNVTSCSKRCLVGVQSREAHGPETFVLDPPMLDSQVF